MPATHTLTVEGHRLVALEYNETAPGTPIIFIHGIASTVAFWEGGVGLSPILNQRRWYSLSLPGHFPAQVPAGFQPADVTPERIASLLTQATRQLIGDQPALLVGHSTGGFAVLAMAAQAPDLATAVVSISGFAQGRWGGVLRPLQMLARQGAIGQALFRFNMQMTTLSPAIYHQVTGFYATDRRAYFAYPELRPTTDKLLEYARQLDLKALGAYFQRMPDIDVADWLPRIRVPVLALTGDSDHIVPPEQARLIAGRVQNGTLREIKGAGHMSFIERPAEYSAIINPWYEQY